MNKFLCVHGHFYQPPRENPWIEEIELQGSACPFHDWNERICAECYESNCYARILDGHNRIVDIVSNYSLISFNFGPTLLSWLEKKAPDVYGHILEADRESLQRLGHGNAIAQAYSHMILPLASEDDMETQVVWGIEDFRFRFKRDPEAMWLPETAVNGKTLDTLYRFGMKFLILSPAQAYRARPFGEDAWRDAASGDIDTRRPYRCFLEDYTGNKSSERFIDIFFYDGSLAAGVSFGDVLFDGARFAEQLNCIYDPDDPGPQLVHVATDGETYGHHKKFGEMALAFALRSAVERYGFELINYGAFLERFPPTWEVELKHGSNKQGTAWSCGHGVGRWQEDCGCRTGSHPGWNQKWRTPLREAMDFLRGSFAEVFEQEGKKYFTDARAARNGYIRVVLERTDDRVSEFFSHYGKEGLTGAERVQALMLLEMQRNAMLMYTSCGWFFDELSGLEATQIMAYADRAIQLAETFAGHDLEGPFVEKLAQAHSNISGYGTGKDIFLRLVRPRRVSMQKVLNHVVIASAFHAHVEPFQRMYHYRIEILEYEKKNFGASCVHMGRVNIQSGITLEEQSFFYVVSFQDGRAFRSVIRQMMRGVNFERVKLEFFQSCENYPGTVFAVMREFFGDDYYGLRDMFHEEKQKILLKLIAEEVKSYAGMYAKLYDDTRATVEPAIRDGLVIPWEFRKAAENTLSKRLHAAIEGLRDGLHDDVHRDSIRRIFSDALELGYCLDLAPSLKLLSDILKEQFENLRDEFSALHSEELRDSIEFIHATRIEELNDFLAFLNSLHLEFSRMVPQNILYRILREKFPALAARAHRGDEKARTIAASLLALAEKIDFSMRRFNLQE